MKNLRLLVVMAAVVAMFVSCTDDDFAEPTITWTPNDLSNFVIIGNESTYNKTLDIAFSAEAGISSIEINKLVYAGIDLYYEAEAVSPTGYSGLIDFDYTFTTTNEMSDFSDGVTKIVYEVKLVDQAETPQEVVKEYTFFVDEAYSVTINVEDEAGNVIDDAIVTFNQVEMAAAPYVFEYVQEGTYEYTVEKEGFETVSVTDFEMADNDTTVSVVLTDLLSAYSDSIFITQTATSTYATYNGNRVEDTENTTIGVKYDSNTASTIVIMPTTNCEGFVVVDNANFTSYTEIVNAYADGTVLDQIELEYDYDSKAFAEKYFVSKVDGAYVFVKYIDGFVNPTAHDGNLGNVVVFQYKN